MAPPLIIICGAFTATGILLNLTDRLATGRVSKFSFFDKYLSPYAVYIFVSFIFVSFFIADGID
jgi:hypothetical protein